MLAGPKLFTIRKIPIHAHWSAFVIFALVGLNLSSVAGVHVAIIAAFAFLGSILVHELAHALTARHFGVGTDRITLWGLGGVAQLQGESPTPRAEGWIAAAGPIMSGVIGAIGIGAGVGLHAAGWARMTAGVLFWLGLTNAALAVFNLLPGAPLDGGRIVSAWRWGRHGNRYRARAEAAQAGPVIGWLMVGVGTWLFLRGIGNLLVPMTGLFIAVNALAEQRGAAAAAQLDGVSVADLTWYGVAEASGDTDAETMLWQRSRLGGAGVVAITDAQGHLTGVVSEERLLKLSIQQRPTVRLTQLMVPLASLARAQPDESLISALARVNPLAPLVTVWRDGRMVGVVPTERLRQRIATR